MFQGFSLDYLKFEISDDHFLTIHGGRLVRNGSEFITNYFEQSVSNIFGGLCAIYAAL